MRCCSVSFERGRTAMPDSVLTVLIVGCGRIAGGFDADRPADALPLTHAGAFRQQGRFRIVACVEPIAELREAFMQRWEIEEGYACIEEVAAQPRRFDVISVCSPTTDHYQSVLSALALQPRLIFCEKPVALRVAETATLVELCRSTGVALAVNHTRRWDPDVRRMRAELDQGLWGAVRSVTGIYSKGILNNGSHMVDLVHLLFGTVTVINVGAPRYDGAVNDPSVPAWLVTGAGIPIYLACGDSRDFSMFEMQIVTERGVIAMEDGGLQWRVRCVVASPHFKGYRSLDAGLLRAGALPQSTLAAVEEIHDVLEGGGDLSSTGSSALRAQQVCEEIRERSVGQ